MQITVRHILKLPRTDLTLKALRRPQGPVLAALKDAAGIYKRAMLKRFDRFSKGDGDWQPLKQATIDRKRSSRILVDTRIMRLGLGADISMTAMDGLRVTMSVRYRTRHPRAKMTVARLAGIHHFGLGRVPVRKILVRPDPITARQIGDRVMRGIRKQMLGF